MYFLILIGSNVCMLYLFAWGIITKYYFSVIVEAGFSSLTLPDLELTIDLDSFKLKEISLPLPPEC